MPVYEYQCQACSHQFEATQKISEPRLVDCPKCQAPKLERLISATSFQLKGGGWYRDGYGDKAKKPRTDNDRIDRLSKALDEDKKKTAASAASSASSSEGGSTSSSDKSQAA